MLQFKDMIDIEKHALRKHAHAINRDFLSFKN